MLVAKLLIRTLALASPTMFENVSGNPLLFHLSVSPLAPWPPPQPVSSKVCAFVSMLLC